MYNKKLFPINDGEVIAKRLATKINGISKFTVCGSIRRRKPMIGDIDIVVVIKNYNQFYRSLEREAKSVIRCGQHIVSINDFHDIQIDFLLTNILHYEAAVLHYTGSKNFNIKCRMAAKSQGWKLNEKGLWLNDKLISSKEKEILTLLNKSDFLSPQTRG